MAKQRIELEAQKTRLDQALEANRQQLLALCTQDKQQGGGIVVTRYQREGAVDYTKIPALQGLDLTPYRKPPVEQVRITVQEEG